MHIVIIEDEPAIRQELALLLRNALYEVTALDDFHDAAAAALAAAPDLILLDVKLPDESGFAVCAKVRAVSDVPIIFLTSQTDAADELNGMLGGGDDYIPMPILLPIPGRMSCKSPCHNHCQFCQPHMSVSWIRFCFHDKVTYSFFATAFLPL